MTKAEIEAMEQELLWGGRDPAWLDWWRSLDHTMCTQIGWPDADIPAYLRCRSMHCTKCNRTTGGQGHFECDLPVLQGISYPG
jgi:hypothetical protein